MAKENPIQGLYDQCINIIKGTIIKYSYLADENEKITASDYDSYVYGFYHNDGVKDYTYNRSEFLTAYSKVTGLSNGYYGLTEDYINEIIETQNFDINYPDILNPHISSEYWEKLQAKYNTQLKAVLLKNKEEKKAKEEYTSERNGFLEMRMYVDTYLDSYYHNDTFTSYTYNYSELYDAYMELYPVEPTEEDDLTLRYLAANNAEIPEAFRDILLRNRRKANIERYVEKNDYYRMLNGKPNIDDDGSDKVYVTPDLCDKYGLDPNIFWSHMEDDTYVPISVDEIEDYYNETLGNDMGTHYMSILETNGCLKEIQDSIFNNPNISKTEKKRKQYIKYLGSKRISIVNARNAKNFEILYLDSTIPKEIADIFVPLYERCREYFTSTIYIYSYRTVFDYYDRFIALCIMVMALSQLIARSIEMSFDRNFFDNYAVQALYEEYDIPFFSKLSANMQQIICQNINLLIQNKGTNKVIYDVASLLGFSTIEVYRYYLMKEHLLDDDGNPKFITKQQVNPTTGELETVYDYNQMFDVYFQKVNVLEKDYHEALENPAKRVDYGSLTEPDPFWIEDEDLVNDVWSTEYNYKETKYLGITISYKLSEMLYSSIGLIRLIFDNKDKLGTINLKPLNVASDAELNLFDAFVALCALLNKKYRLTGEVVTKPSQIISVINTTDEWANNNTERNSNDAYQTFAFNFDWINSDDYNEVVNTMMKYMTEDEISEFLSYLTILNVPDTTNEEKIHAINLMYMNIKGMARFLSEKLSNTKNIYEYRAFRRFYRSIFYCEQISDMFMITDHSTSERRPATTFLEYLEFTTPSFAEFIDELDADDAHIYIDYIINQIEAILEDNDDTTNIDFSSLHTINKSTSILQEVLVTLIKFFKSYTTDLVGLNTVYIFDFKPENIIKILDEMWNIYKTIEATDSLNMSYADSINRIKVLACIKDNMLWLEEIFIRSTIFITDDLILKDMLRIIKRIDLREYLNSVIFRDVITIHINNTLYDEISEHKFRDLIKHIDKTDVLVEFMILLENLYANKVISEEEEMRIYDAVNAVNKELSLSGSIRLKDALFIKRNTE